MSELTKYMSSYTSINIEGYDLFYCNILMSYEVGSNLISISQLFHHYNSDSAMTYYKVTKDNAKWFLQVDNDRVFHPKPLITQHQRKPVLGERLFIDKQSKIKRSRVRNYFKLANRPDFTIPTVFDFGNLSASTCVSAEPYYIFRSTKYGFILLVSTKIKHKGKIASTKFSEMFADIKYRSKRVNEDIVDYTEDKEEFYDFIESLEYVKTAWYYGLTNKLQGLHNIIEGESRLAFIDDTDVFELCNDENTEFDYDFFTTCMEWANSHNCDNYVILQHTLASINYKKYSSCVRFLLSKTCYTDACTRTDVKYMINYLNLDHRMRYNSEFSIHRDDYAILKKHYRSLIEKADTEDKTYLMQQWVKNNFFDKNSADLVIIGLSDLDKLDKFVKYEDSEGKSDSSI